MSSICRILPHEIEGSSKTNWYNAKDIYKYIGKKRRSLNVIYARVSTPKQKADLARQTK
jgi:predicted site-specific integrase-resolvase